MTILTAILQGPLFDDNSDSSSSSDSTSSPDTRSSDTSASTNTTSTDSGTPGNSQSAPDYSQPSSYMPSDYQYSTQPDQSSQQQTDNSAFTNASGMQGQANGQAMNLTVHDGSSFTDPQTLAKSLGVDYSRDPNSSTVYIGGQPFSVIGYDTNGNAQVGVRNVAETLGGYNVSYDPNSNSVKVDRSATQGMSGPTNVNDQSFLNQDPQSRLQSFAQDPNLANQEMSRVQQVYNDAQARGDQATMSAAQAWANQVTKVSGIGYKPDSQIPNPIFNAPTNTVAHPTAIGSAAAAGMQQQRPYQVPFMQPQPMQSVIPQLSQYMPQQPQLQPFVMPDVSQYYSHLMPYQSFNPDFNNYYTQAHNQVDPLLQNQQQALINKENLDVTKMNESMNRRGIWSSGIAQQAENDLRAKTNDSIAKVFMNGQSQLSKIAMNLYNNAFNQYKSGNQMALQNNKMYMDQAMNTMKNQFNMWLQGQRLSMQQYQYASQAFDKFAGLVEKDAQMQMQNQHFYDQQNSNIAGKNATMDWNNYKFGNLSADQEANLNQKYNQMMLPYTQGPTPAQQLPYEYQTANNQATTQLEMWKMLGYVQTPDGTLQPTLQASNDQRTYALNFAKAMGYMVNQDGSITPTEQARHDMAGEQYNQQHLAAQISQWATQNSLSKSRMGLDAAKFNEKTWYDQQLVAKAQDSALDSAKRLKLDGYKAELQTKAQQVNQYLTNNKPVPADLASDYDTVMSKIAEVVGDGKSAPIQGPTTSTTPWSYTTDENGVIQSGE